MDTKREKLTTAVLMQHVADKHDADPRSLRKAVAYNGKAWLVRGHEKAHADGRFTDEPHTHE